MLTHHLYTSGQKAQIEAKFRSPLSELGSNKLSNQQQSVRHHNSICLDSYTKIRMYRHRSIEEIHEAACGVTNNHTAGNLQHNITTSSSRSKIGAGPRILFKEDFFKFSVQQIEFFSRDTTKRGTTPATLLKSTVETSFWPKDSTNTEHRGFASGSLSSSRDASKRETARSIELANASNTRICGRKEGLDKLTLNCEQLNSEEFLRYATEDIEVSTAFQRYLQENSVHPIILRLAEENMSELIVNRFGCHVLRVLLQKSSTIFDRLVNLVKREFAVYCCNQFSNKVIQALAEQEVDFSKNCLEQIYNNWESVKMYIPTSYLLNVCLSRVPATSNQFKLIGQALIARSQSIWKDKFDKRLLLDYLNFCPTGQLEYFFNALNYQLHFEKRIQDRYLAQALGILFNRGLHLAHELVLNKLSEPMAYFLSLRNFRLLLVELLEGQSEPSPESRRLAETLLSAPEIISMYSEVEASAKKAVSYMQHSQYRTKM